MEISANSKGFARQEGSSRLICCSKSQQRFSVSDKKVGYVKDEQNGVSRSRSRDTDRNKETRRLRHKSRERKASRSPKHGKSRRHRSRSHEKRPRNHSHTKRSHSHRHRKHSKPNISSPPRRKPASNQIGCKTSDQPHKRMDDENRISRPNSDVFDSNFTSSIPFQGINSSGPLLTGQTSRMPKFWDQASFVCVLVGMPYTGKTSQLRRLFLTRNEYLWGKFDWTFFFSPNTLDDIDCIPGETWFSDVTFSLLYNITHWASTFGKSNGITKVLFVFDDMTQSLSDLWKNPDFKRMFDQRRHLFNDTVCLSFLITAQRFVNQIPKDIRRAITDLLLLPVNEGDVTAALNCLGFNVKEIRTITTKAWQRNRFDFFYMTTHPYLALSYGYENIIPTF